MNHYLQYICKLYKCHTETRLQLKRTMLYQHNARQRIIIKSPQINLHIYGQFIFKEASWAIQGGKNNAFNKPNRAETTEQPEAEELRWTFTSHFMQKLTQKDDRAQCKSLNYKTLGEKHWRETFCDLSQAMISLV